MIGNFNDDETNFPHKLLLTNTQVQGFVNLLKMVHELTQLSKMVQLGGYFVNPLRIFQIN